MRKQVVNRRTASLLSEQKIRIPIAIGIVAKPEQSEHKSNTKKLC